MAQKLILRSSCQTCKKFVPSTLLPPGTHSQCMKEENILRNSRFFWGTENTFFPAAVAHSQLLNTSLKRVKPPDCARGASLAHFALLLYKHTWISTQLYSPPTTEDSPLPSVPIKCVHQWENLVFLILPYYLCSSFMLHRNRIPLKSPKVELFRMFSEDWGLYVLNVSVH